MTRFLASLFIGLAIGAGVGLFLGWGPFPVVYTGNPGSQLHERYKDEYTVMVAAGYLLDHDPQAAVERLQMLGVANAPVYVQEVTERYITNSRDIEDIRQLVALLEALIGADRLPDLMQSYRIARPTVP